MICEDARLVELGLAEQGFSFVEPDEFALRELADAEKQRNVFHLCNALYRFSEDLRRRRISGNDIPSCKAVALKLARNDYVHWGDLPADLDGLLLRLQGVGRRTTDKLRRHLEQMGASVIPGEPPKPACLYKRVRRVMEQLPERFKILPVLVDSLLLPRPIVDQLRDQGCRTLGDLCSLEDQELLSLRGVGKAKVTRIREAIEALCRRYDQLVRGIGILAPSRVFWLEGRPIAVPESALAKPVTCLTANSGALEQAASRLLSLGISVIGDLPESLSNVCYPGGLSSRTVRLLGDALELWAATHDDGLRDGVGLEANHALDALVSLINGLVCDGPAERVKPHQWAIFIYWAVPRENGRTLDAVGTRFGVTRERVRQVVTKVARRIANGHQHELKLANAKVTSMGGFALFSSLCTIQPRNLLAEGVMTKVLATQGLYYHKQNRCITTLRPADRGAVVRQLRQFLREQLQERVVDLADLTDCISRYSQKHKLPMSAVEALLQIARSELVTSLGQGFWCTSPSKAAVAAHVFREYVREYPEGIRLYQEVAALKDFAERRLPGFFESERSLLTSLLRSDEAVLWDWGVYISKDQVKVTAQDLVPIANWIDKQFRQGLAQMSSRRAFLRFRDALTSLGVSSEHALYSCLRLYYPDMFNYPKCPKLFPLDGPSSLGYSEMVEQWLESKGALSYQELRQEFVNNRGWREFQLTQALANSEHILRVGLSQYDLYSRYDVSQRSLEPLASYLEAILAQHHPPTISIRLLFNQRRATCAELGIPNEYVLFALLARSLGHRFDLRRFPNVSLALGEQEATNRDLVADFALQAGRSLLKEEFRREFVTRRGWTDGSLDYALRSGALMPLASGMAAEYVHPLVLGWDEDRTTELEVMVQDKLREIDERRIPFGHLLWDLLHKLPLPPLQNGVGWTPELLKNLLGRMDFVLLIGWYVVAHFPNSADVADEDEFVAWVLERQFGGAGKIHEVEERLIQAGFRSASGFLSAQARATEVPWRIVGNEVILETQTTPC